MDKKTSQDHYLAFVEFVRSDAQKERRAVNRRLLNAFLWCFVLPIVASVVIFTLVKTGVLPRRFRGWMDWLILFFPVLYSLYVLSQEVIREIPAALRRGGIANTLRQVAQEGQWRSQTCEAMRHAMKDATVEDWNWVIQSYRIDLNSIQARVRYLTALAGAVFFLLFEGIDYLTDADVQSRWWQPDSGDFIQMMGVGLFLVLLYLSGMQSFQFLRRYLDCAELAAPETSFKKRD